MDPGFSKVSVDARGLVVSLSRLCRAIEAALESRDGEHAAIMVAAGRRLLSHPAADELVDAIEWHRERRRFASLAKLNLGPVPTERAADVDRALELTLRGFTVFPIDLCARFEFDPPVELPPFDPSKFRIVSLGE